MTNPPSIKISGNTAALATVLRLGGHYSYAALCDVLRVHRDTLNTCLATLEELGAITYTKGRAGRPRRGQVGGELDVTVLADSWVWEALGLEVK